MPLKFTIERQALHDAMSAVGKIVKSSSTIPILNNVLVSSDGNRLSILATDLDRFATILIDADIDSDGAFTVDAGDLARIAASSPDGSQIRFAEGESVVTATVAKARYRLPHLPVSDFPSPPAIASNHRFAMAATDLVKALGACQTAISTEETRYYLNGINISGRKDGVHFAATDGHRLTHAVMKGDQEIIDALGGVSESIILPAAMVSQLLRLLPEDGAVEVEFSEARMAFAWGDIRIDSKLIDGNFPDFFRVIPRHEKSVTVPIKVLAELARRVAGFAEAEGKERSRALRLVLEPGRLEISAGPSANITAADEMPIEGPAAKFQIGVNGKYLIQALEEVEGDDVTIGFEDPVSPLLMKFPGDPGVTRVLMPLRID